MIAISKYDGPDGPVIRIALDTPRDLAALDSLFQRLSSGQASTVDLHEEPQIALDALDQLTLSLAPAMRTETVSVSPDGSVRWTKTREGWEEASELLSGLTMHTHNYLGSGDATVEIQLGTQG